MDSQEFENYITNQNIALGVQRIRQLYETIRDSDKALDANTERKGITINDLIAYFENETEVPEMNIDPNAIKSISDIEAYITASNLTGRFWDAAQKFPENVLGPGQAPAKMSQKCPENVRRG